MATKHPKTGLMGTCRTGRVAIVGKRRATVSDRLVEYGGGCANDAFDGVFRAIAPVSRWMQPSYKQYFINIDITETSDNALVEQNRLHGRAS